MIRILGILNLTPDSFFPGSRLGGDNALSRISKLFEEGADVVDLGACSTRPGADIPSLETEWARLEPVLRDIAKADDTAGAGHKLCPAPADPTFSIDTFRSEIVRRAYDIIGKFIVNDVSGGSKEMLETVRKLGLPYVATHNRPFEGDVVEDVKDYFREMEDAGIADLIMDPGFGFEKTVDQNLELLRRLDEITSATKLPVLVGISRKSMIYKTLGITPEEALPATQALHFSALERGAKWLRVHDVTEAAQTVKLFERFWNE